MTVVFHLADGIFSTKISLAYIHALVRESVAELVRRTVSIFQAIDLGTSILVGISLVKAARWTDTFSNMIPGDANSTRAALEVVAGRLASFTPV